MLATDTHRPRMRTAVARAPSGCSTARTSSGRCAPSGVGSGERGCDIDGLPRDAPTVEGDFAGAGVRAALLAYGLETAGAIYRAKVGRPLC